MEKGDPKTVLISGATRGIGWETALTLAREGYRVFAGYRSEEGKNKILTQVQGANLNLQPILLDVTVPASCQQAVRTTLDRAGRIDCLINNAGFGLAGPIEHVPLEEYRKQFETNFFGHITVSKEVIPIMRKQKSGTIIHISSVSGQFGYPFFSPYCASKHALEAFGESMRFELKPFGIHVVLIEPGMIRTDFVQKNLIVEQSALAEGSPYRKAAQAIKEKYYQRDDASPPPNLVAKKISKILRLKNPKLRYTVRWDSGLQTLLKRILPQSWVERLVLKIYNLENLYAKEN